MNNEKGYGIIIMQGSISMLQHGEYIWRYTMERIYKTLRFSREAKYWLNKLISYYDKQLYNQLTNQNLLENAEKMLADTFSLEGVSINLDLNVTTGSIIDLAIRLTDSFDLQDWRKLEDETDIASDKIPVDFEDNTLPRIYFPVETLERLEYLRIYLCEDAKRGPRQTYIIKCALYNLYKQTFK